jgi:hypothetical protein
MSLTHNRINDVSARGSADRTALPVTQEDHAARANAAMQAQRLRELWCQSRDRARTAPVGSPAFARVADLAASFAAMAVRAEQPAQARVVVGDALTTLRVACLAEGKDAARHLAFARTLELAAAYEVASGDARAAFDALRAAITTIGPFSAALREPATDPLMRMSIANGLMRPITTAARMLNDAEQRTMAFRQVWEESRAWAKAARGASDHAAAIEMAVVAAFELAVEEHVDSASGCLERCEQLRRHIESLQKLRGDDAVVRTHRAAFARLSADAWQRLGDTAEAERLLNEAARHLSEAATKPDADQRELTKQRAALSAQRIRLAERSSAAG